MTALLELETLSVGEGAAPALAEVSLALAAGEVMALLGANGAGKSTLLRAILGLAPVAAGRVRFGGRDLAALPVERRARLGIGYVPEGRRIFPGLTVAETLEVASWEGRAARARRREAVYGLFPPLRESARRRAWQLSGGQQQMLAIGRALMAGPRLLLLDEPSLGLAPALAARLMGEVRRIAAGGTAVLLAEQNPPLALAIADRAMLLRRGRAVAAGPPAAIGTPERLADAFLGG